MRFTVCLDQEGTSAGEGRGFHVDVGGKEKYAD